MPSARHVALAASRDVRQLPWRPPVQAAAGRAPQSDISVDHRAICATLDIGRHQLSFNLTHTGA